MARVDARIECCDGLLHDERLHTLRLPAGRYEILLAALRQISIHGQAGLLVVTGAHGENVSLHDVQMHLASEGMAE